MQRPSSYTHNIAASQADEKLRFVRMPLHTQPESFPMLLALIIATISTFLPEPGAASGCQRIQNGTADLNDLVECSQSPETPVVEVTGEKHWTIRLPGRSAPGEARFLLHPDVPIHEEQVVVRLTPTAGGETIQLSIPATRAREFALAAPAGAWSYSINTPFFAEVRGDLHLGPTPVRREHRLRALRTVSGKVIAPDGSPAGTTFQLGEAMLGEVAANGSFRLAIPESTNESLLRITKPGLPTHYRTLPDRPRDVQLGEILLSRGGSLHAVIQTPPALNENATITIQALSDDEEPASLQRHATDPEGRLSLRETLPAGRYRLLIEGPESLQVFAHTFDIEPYEETDARIEIRPIRLELEVTDSRHEAASRAEVHLANQDAEWSRQISLDERGIADLMLWQGGGFTAAVRSPEHRSYFVARNDISEDEHWKITTTGARLAGKVVGEDGIAIPGARTLLISRTPTGQRTTLQDTDDDGTFQYDYLTPGVYVMTAHAEGFNEATSEITVEDDQTITVVLAAEAGRDLIITSATGQPLQGVAVTDGSATYPFTTDATGRAKVPITRGRTRYYLIPPQGSFAVADVTTGETPVTIRVPDGRASIRIGMRTTDGRGLPGVAFAVRYNGQFLPQPVVQLLSRVQRAEMRTDETGWAHLHALPTGFYEFWPVLDFARYSELATHAPAPAAAVYANPGESTIEMTFESR